MMTSRTTALAASVLAGCLLLCGAVEILQAQGTSPLDSLLANIKSHPALIDDGVGGCGRLHHLWKAQALALSAPAEGRDQALRDTVFAPNQAFWAAYLGDEAAFTKWARSAKPLLDDPRLGVPLQSQIGPTIVDTTRRLEELTGRRACADWFIVYGPGWTNLGGLGNKRMVVDILGLPTSDPIGDIRFALPHELNHVLFDDARSDNERGSLLYRIIDEGFATFVADEYWGIGLSAAQALGYTPEQWAWAVEHEAALWQEARPQLTSKDRKVLDTFSSASRSVLAGAPGKAGYFLGYRIVDDFVRRNGAQSWRRLYDMPLADIISATRFAANSLR
jgi:hypothetical protein